MGKTSLVLQWAANIAAGGQRVVFFTLEMSADQLVLQLACSRARVIQDRVKRGTVTVEEYEQLLSEIGQPKGELSATH